MSNNDADGDGKEKENILFNDTFNTFYLRLYGVGHMVKRGNPLPPHWATISG